MIFAGPTVRRRRRDIGRRPRVLRATTSRRSPMSADRSSMRPRHRATRLAASRARRCATPPLVGAPRARSVSCLRTYPRAGAAAGRPARARRRRADRRVHAGGGEPGGDARLSDRVGARPLDHQFGAAGGDALVRRAGGRDQADLRLFLPRHERQSACAHFRARLRQCARHRRRSRSPTDARSR